MQYANITLHSNGQLWSNPTLRSTLAGLSAMLVKPSFLDLVQLSVLFTPEKVAGVNDDLLQAGEIAQPRHRTTASMLANIERGLHAHR